MCSMCLPFCVSEKEIIQIVPLCPSLSDHLSYFTTIFFFQPQRRAFKERNSRGRLDIARRKRGGYQADSDNIFANLFHIRQV